MNPEGTGSARAEVLAELRRLAEPDPPVDGSIVATTDGLVIAHDLGATETYGVRARRRRRAVRGQPRA